MVNSGINLNVTISAGGVPAGTRVYYSLGGDPEIWEKETSRVQIKYTDAIAGRSRQAIITISDPGNVKDQYYSPFTRIKLLDYTSNTEIFLGRAISSVASWDTSLGLILTVTAQDYMYELTARYAHNVYTGMTRADMVAAIIADNTTSGSLAISIIPNSVDLISRDFSNSNTKASEAIEAIAIDDGAFITSDGIATVGCDYRVNDDNIPQFKYFPRGSQPEGGVSQGMTISLTNPVDDQTKRMLSDYNFTVAPQDIITHIICRGTDASGNKIFAEQDNPVAVANNYGIRTDLIDVTYGVTTYDFLLKRAQQLCTVYGSVITRGKCSIFGYPIFKYAGEYQQVRAGDVIFINNILQNINTSFVVLDFEYNEPSMITTFDLLDLASYGRELPQNLNSSISAADIGDLPYIPSKFHHIVFFVSGSLSTGTNVSAEITLPWNFICTDVDTQVKQGGGPGTMRNKFAKLGVGLDTQIDIKLDGISIFSGTYPTIAEGQTIGTPVVPTITKFNVGQMLTLDILEADDSGAYDLTVTVCGYETPTIGEAVPITSTPVPPVSGGAGNYFSVHDGQYFDNQVDLEAHLTSIWGSIPDNSLVYAIYDSNVISGVTHGTDWPNYAKGTPITIAIKGAATQLDVYYDTGYQTVLAMVPGSGSLLQSYCYIGTSTMNPFRYTDSQPISLGTYYLRWLVPAWNPSLDPANPAVYFTSNIVFHVTE